MRAAVIGAGAWGTALADLLASNGHDTTIWALEPNVADTIRSCHENQRFLQGFKLAPSLRATNDLHEALDRASFVVYAVPSQHLRGVAREGTSAVAPGAVLSIASKGIERGTLALMTTVIEEEVPGRPVVAISGPSFASEVAARQPTAIVAASTDERAALVTQDALSSNSFRVYTNDDVVGVELGGALKNVMAVATGIVEGVGLGHNSRAALITRGLHEMTKLGVALGGRLETFAGLAGMGDLVLTCTGSLSRNRSLGVALGQGKKLEAILSETRAVAEGVKTSKAVQEIATRHEIEMPIASEMYRVMYEGQPARTALQRLMSRSLKAESDL